MSKFRTEHVTENIKIVIDVWLGVQSKEWSGDLMTKLKKEFSHFGTASVVHVQENMDVHKDIYF